MATRTPPHRQAGPSRTEQPEPPFSDEEYEAAGIHPPRPRTSQQSYKDDVRRQNEDEARAHGATEEQIAGMFNPEPRRGERRSGGGGGSRRPEPGASRTSSKEERTGGKPIGRAITTGYRGARTTGRAARYTAQQTSGLVRGRRSGTVAAGVLGLLGYAVAINLIHGGPAQVKGWFGAKFLNKPWTPPSGSSTMTTTPAVSSTPATLLMPTGSEVAAPQGAAA